MSRILRVKIDGCHNCILKKQQKTSFFKSGLVCFNPLNEDKNLFFVDLNVLTQTFHENCRLQENKEELSNEENT